MRKALALVALAACKGEPPVYVIDTDHNALAVVIRATDNKPVHASGTCTADDDGETRALARQGKAEVVDLPLAGLRDDTSWTCTVDIDDGRRTKSWEVTVEPGPVPLKIGGYATEGTSDPAGATLITAWDHDQGYPNVRSVIVDPQGRVRWYRFTDFDVTAGLDSTLTTDGLVLTGGGPDQPPTWYDALGDVTRQLGEPPIPGAYHHHVEPFEDGVVTLTTTKNTLGGREFTGFVIQHIGPFGAEEWSWNSQQAVDAGTLVPTAVDDAFHVNSVSLLDDDLGPAAWVSLWAPGLMARIDRDTGEVTHLLGVGGDFTLLDPSGTELPASDWFFGTHDPEFAWPSVLLYDNGIASSRSRAVELELDLAANTATLTWEWTEDGWYEPFFGDADAIADGKVLLSRGRCWQSCDPMHPPDDRVSDLVEIDRNTGEITWRLVPPDSDRGFYRAERIDPCLLWDDPELCSD